MRRPTTTWLPPIIRWTGGTRPSGLPPKRCASSRIIRWRGRISIGPGHIGRHRMAAGKRREWLLCGGLVLAVLAVYANHFQNNFHFDDSHTLYYNGAIQ